MLEIENPSLYGIAIIVVIICVALAIFNVRRPLKLTNINYFVYLSSLTLSLFIAATVIGKPFVRSYKLASAACFLIDISESMSETTAQTLLEQAQLHAQKYTTVYTIPFGGRPRSKPINGLPTSYSKLKRANQELNLGSSNLELVLNQSLSLDVSEIFLISDAWETKGNSNNSIKELSKKNNKLHVLLPNNNSKSEKQIQLKQIVAPTMVNSGSKTDVNLVVLNGTNQEQFVDVIFRQNEEIVEKQKLSLTGNSPEKLKITTKNIEQGPQELSIEIQPNNSSYSDIKKRFFISGSPREQVLLVGSSEQETKLLNSILSQNNFKLDTVYTEMNKLTTTPNLKKYKTVIFNNVPKSAFTNELPQELKSYVKNGGTFIMTGGNKSFGLGGYIDTEVEEILPVKLLPPQRKTKRLNVAVMLLLDKSGSMRKEQKLDFAKLAAREVVRSLKDPDYIGIIGIDDAPFITQQIGQLAQVRAEAARKIGLLYAVGGTNFLPGIDIAKRHLERVPAGRKHIIMLTDGKLPDGYTMRPYYLKLIEDMRLSGITLSSFLVGGESGGLLREMANVGGGAFHRTRSAQNLPKLFLNDIRVSTGEKTQKESERYKVRKAAPNSIVSTSLRNFPDLLGYTQTKAKTKAQLELLVRNFRQADPLLASWDFYKGRVIAFTSDVSGRWSKNWVQWKSFNQFWIDLVSPKTTESAATNENIELDLKYKVQSDKLHLYLSFFTEKLDNTPVVELTLPDQKLQTLDLQQQAPGYFEAIVNNPLAGDYYVKSKLNDRPLTELAFELPGELFGEQKNKGYNTKLLYKLANETSGKFNPNTTLLESDFSTIESRTPLGRSLIIYSLLLIIITMVARERLKGRV